MAKFKILTHTNRQYTPKVSFRNLLPALAIGIALTLPQSVSARTTQALDFTAGNINATWVGKGTIQMMQTPSGILLKTTETGTFITNTDLTINPQAAAIVATVDQPLEMYFVWIFKNDPEERTYDVGVALQKGTNIKNAFSLSDVAHWNQSPKKLGIVLPPHSTVLLHGIEFTEWNWLERMTVGITSFWKFDRYRPYSINFVWGPAFATNPIEAQELYSVLPPPSISGMFVAYWKLIILLLLCSAFCTLRKKPKRHLAIIGGIVILVMWFVMDIRMGSEFLSYVAHDQKTYIGQPDASRTFRDRDRFYDFAAFAEPYVFDRSSYVFFAQQQWPYLGNIRYVTYPSIPGFDIDHDDTWIIYDRPDVSLSAKGEILVGGEVFSSPGRILARFDETSFVFRTNEKPTPPAQP